MNLRAATGALSEIGEVVAISPFLEYAAVDSPSGAPAFLNAAAHLRTKLSATDLLQGLLAIEQEMGRVRSIKNAPRLIDLDLLIYDQLQLHEANLHLPHPRMHLRRFVLEPLAAIAPELRHSGLNKSILQLFSELL